jgi:FkbM family methyltransferase
MTYVGRVYRKIKVEATKLIHPVGLRRVIHTRINNYDLLVLINEDVGRQIHFTGQYEFDETRFLRQAIRTDDICLDVGGNIGYFSMLMATLARNGEVHVFEPIELNLALMRGSIELNGFQNIRIVHAAVGDKSGNTSFTVSQDSAFSSIHDTARRPVDRVITVPLISLDEYVLRETLPRVDILKVDVEGAEGLVIEGARNLLMDPARRPRIIFMELFDPNLVHFSCCIEIILEKMKAVGYKAYILQRNSLTPFLIEMKTRFCNVIFSPE